MATPPTAASRTGTRVPKRQAAVEQTVRRMMARELHDRVAQTLTGMLVEVENFKSEPVAWEDVIRQLDMVQSSTRQVLTSLRQLLHDLRGEEAQSDTFVDAIGALIVRFEEKTRIRANLAVLPGWPEALTPPASLNLLRIVEEALANVRWHSGAQSVRIVLQQYSDNEVSLVVGDDGRGLDTDQSHRAGLGTLGMKERAVLMGGWLQIESESGGGTTVRAVFPKQYLIPTDLELKVAWA